MSYDYAGQIAASNKTYQDTLQGYRDTLASTQQQQAALSQQYNTSSQEAIAGLQGTQHYAETQAEKAYELAQSKNLAYAVGHGLGSSSLAPSLNMNATKNYADTLSKVYADFGGQVSQAKQNAALASLNFGGTSIGQQVGINQAQLGYMGQFAGQQLALAPQLAQLNTQERGQDMDYAGRKYASDQDLRGRMAASNIAQYGRGTNLDFGKMVRFY